jgi:hypothetical protein
VSRSHLLAQSDRRRDKRSVQESLPHVSTKVRVLTPDEQARRAAELVERLRNDDLAPYISVAR